MVSAFDGRINDQEELKDPGKSRPSTAMTSDLPADKSLGKKDAEKGEEATAEDYEDCRPRTPIVTGPIIELHGREVIFAIGVFFLFAIVVGLVVILASQRVKDKESVPNNSSNVTSGEETEATDGAALPVICPSPGFGGEHAPASTRLTPADNGTENQGTGGDFSAAWVLTAASLLQNMNKSADPCDDFWEFSCGGWLDRMEIPPGLESVGVDRDLETRIRRDIETILEEPLKRDEVHSAEKKFKDLYHTCMDTRAIEALGSRPFLEIVDRLGGWAFLPDWNLAEKSGGWSILRALSEVQFSFDVEAFFSIAVGKDDKNSSINILQFDQSGLGLSRTEYFVEGGNSTTIRSYKKYMETVAMLFGATDEMADEFAQSTFQMEHNLAMLHAAEHSDDRWDSESMYNNLTVSNLQIIAPRINWTLFLRAGFPSVTEDTVVLVTSTQYMANVSSLISNAKESDVSNYLLWRLTFGLASPLLSEPFRSAHQEFKRGTKASPPTDTASRVSSRQSYCQKVVAEWFGHALSAEYVRRKDFDGREDEILEMIANIKDVYREAFQKCDWMDNVTRENALRKLESMQERVGYPHFILNNVKLDEYYDGFDVEGNASFFSNILNGLKHQKQRRSHALELNVQTEDWSMNPFEVNAFYSLTENIIGFSAGLLQKPFYDRGAPNYVNYASLGSTIAHEIAHAFDENGAKYDSEGNLREWWTEETLEQFTNRTGCVENYYGGLSVNGIQVNGELTLNENLADIGSLKHAFDAYKTWEKRHQVELKLPGLKLRNDEIFFVAFAQNWCKSRRKTSVKNFMSRSNHAIEEIRVRGTVSQTEYFASVFQCPLGSPMNPPNKCRVW